METISTTTRRDTFVLPSSDESALASYCFICGAAAGQPCQVRKTGRVLSKPHESRRPHRVINRFVSADSNRMTSEAIDLELAARGSNAGELLRYSPLDNQVIDESGAYITFVVNMFSRS